MPSFGCRSKQILEVLLSLEGSDGILEVVVTHISLNSAGGGELVCLSLIKALRNSGNRVTLATVDKTDWLRLKKIFGKITVPDQEFYVLSYSPRTSLGTVNSALLVALFWAELLLLRLIKRHYLMINTCGEKVNSIADIAYFNGIPLRCAFLLRGTNAKRRCLSILYNLFSKTFDKINPSLIVANSRFNKGLIQKCIKNPAVVVYPPVNVQRFRDLKRKSEDIVLTYSQYVPTQNLGCVARIAKIAQEANFVIIGPSGSTSKNTLKELHALASQLSIRDRVTFLTNQPFSRYIELLSIAKVFLRTLQNEPFGISVVEAMAAGCVPVVPSNGGTWYDILDQKQGKYGYSYRSVEEAAEIIDMLIEDDRLRLEISNRAAQRAHEFEISIFDRKILGIIEKTVSS